MSITFLRDGEQQLTDLQKEQIKKNLGLDNLDTVGQKTPEGGEVFNTDASPSNIASGTGSHAEGQTKATAGWAHSEGYLSEANGYASHAEGSSIAVGSYTHAEGFGTQAGSITNEGVIVGGGAHSEGIETEASGEGSHAEGCKSIASGLYSHAAGNGSKATNAYTHAEGDGSEATGNTSHAEGYHSMAKAYYSHAENLQTTASGTGSHAEGEYTQATAEAAHSEGFRTEASGVSSHAEGHSTKATKNQAHAEGYSTTASGQASHAEGGATFATGEYTHAEGYNATAAGGYTHAEGKDTIASGAHSHAEGRGTKSYGAESHTEGLRAETTTAAQYAHAEGYETKAQNIAAHAEGVNTIASGQGSHAGGLYTVADGYVQTAIGRYNKTGTNALFVVGDGTGTAAAQRADAFAVNKDGTVTTGKEDYVLAKSVDTKTKAEEFCSLFANASGDVSSFLFFTDPHFFHPSNTKRNMDSSIKYLQRYYEETPTSFVVNGGDMLQSGDTKAQACYNLGYIDGKMHSAFDKYYYVFGNHDNNYQGAAYPGNNISTHEDTLTQTNIRNLCLRDQEKTYYSFKDGLTRYYVFDTGLDWDATVMSDYRWEQVNWFAKSLMENDDKYNVIIAHQLYYAGTTLNILADNLLEVAGAYNHGASDFTINGQTYDFSNAAGRVHYYLAGHSHTDSYDVLKGIACITTKHTYATNWTTPTFDLVLANYGENMLHLVRVGDGENRTIDIDPA